MNTAGSESTWVRHATDAVACAAVGAGYFALAWLSTHLTPRTGDIAYLWPAGGFILGMLLVAPKRLWLRKMDEKAGSITFDGTAATIDDVSAFMKALEESQYFGKVDLKKTTAKAEKGMKLVEFTLVTGANYNPMSADAVAASGAAVPTAGAR